MPSLLPGLEYDIFISYRQKDNKGERWVTSFVETLRNELDATFKESVSIYFDENPHDGLLEAHQVGGSLEGKLRCAVFIPILSQTYCDPKSFAWQQEFCAFNRNAKEDAFGREVRLHGGNVASRILPVRVHELDSSDKDLYEREVEGVLRAIDFIYKTPGVNRPLTPSDKKEENINRSVYRDQVNKVANAVKEVLSAMMEPVAAPGEEVRPILSPLPSKSFWVLAKEREVARVALVYALFALVVYRLASDGISRGYGAASWLSTLLVVLAIGLPLALWLAWTFEFSPWGLIRTDSASSKSNPYTAVRKKPLTGNVSLLLLVLLLVVQLAIVPKPDSKTTKSIAVLYFDNLSNDPEQEFFTAGITDEISAHLSRIPNLRVTSRTSVLPYKGKSKAKNIRQIADELGVDNVLDGSVQKSGNKLHITAQLIEAKTDKSLWSETFDREVTEVFRIQSEIAQAIAGKFSLSLTPDVRARLNEIPTQNMEAYQLYLNAKALPEVTGGGIGTSYKTTNKGVELCRRAIKHDPDFGDAYLLLAHFYSQLEDKYDSAILIAKEGVLANPTSPNGYSMLAQLTNELRWLKRTLALDTVAGLMEFGRAFNRKGDLQKAVACLMEALRRRPNDSNILLQLATTYAFIEGDSVKKYIEATLKLDPLSMEVCSLRVSLDRFRINPEQWKILAANYYNDDSLGYYKDLGVAYLYTRRWKEALDAYAKTNYRDLDVGLALIKTGQVDSGRQVMKKSLEYHMAHRGDLFNVPRLYSLPRLYAVLGNREEALSNYRLLFRSIGWSVKFCQIDPFTDYIREDPEYKRLETEALAKVNEALDQIRRSANKKFRLEVVLAGID